MSEEHEFYNNSVPKEILQQKVDFINFRWKELYELEVKYDDEAMKYLFYVNAGGAAAVLAFIGASSEMRSSCSIKVSLLFFAIGLLLDGILIAFQLHRAGFIFDEWRNDTNSYFKQKKKYSEIIEADEARSNRSKSAFILGYCSL